MPTAAVGSGLRARA